MLEIGNGNVQSLLQASDLLQFDKVKDYCSDFISKQIDELNCFDVYHLADRYSCQLLLSAVLSFFKNHFKTIIASNTFQHLQFDFVRNLLRNGDLCVQDEGDVLIASLHWLSHDYPKRMRYKRELFRFVQFPFIAPKRLDFIYENYDKKKCILPPRKQVSSLKPYSIRKCKTLEVEVRKSYGQWLYVIGGEQSFLSEISDIELFNHSVGSWELSKPLRSPRSSFAAAVIDRKLYLIGGMRRGVKLRSAKCYDAETSRWTTLPPPLRCRGDVKAAVANKILYIAGGSGERESACRYYSPIILLFHLIQ